MFASFFTSVYIIFKVSCINRTSGIFIVFATKDAIPKIIDLTKLASIG
jgi:hypothetical protein